MTIGSVSALVVVRRRQITDCTQKDCLPKIVANAGGLFPTTRLSDLKNACPYNYLKEPLPDMMLALIWRVLEKRIFSWH